MHWQMHPYPGILLQYHHLDFPVLAFKVDSRAQAEHLAESVLLRGAVTGQTVRVSRSVSGSSISLALPSLGAWRA